MGWRNRLYDWWLSKRTPLLAYVKATEEEADTGLAIARRAGISPGVVYVQLGVLEDEGLVRAKWVVGLNRHRVFWRARNAQNTH